MNFYREVAKTAKKNKTHPYFENRRDIILNVSPSFALSRWIGFFLLSLVLSSCSSVPLLKDQPSQEEVQTQLFLSQAAHEFQAPNAPKSMSLKDTANVEWRADKSMKVTVHQMWACRVKPDRPLPPIATLNQDSQTLAIQTLQLYDLDEKGNFVKSPTKAEIQWTVPEENLPTSLSKIATAKLPELGAGQALELQYSLETKTANLLVDNDSSKDPKTGARKLHPIAAEGSFAFRWNDYVPSLKRELTMRVPKALELYATRFRVPKNLKITEEKLATKDKAVSFTMEPLPSPIPAENYQPALQDLAPLTAFTVNKSWDDAVMPYRKRVRQVMDAKLDAVDQLLGDALGNTTASLEDRLADVKYLIHQKVEWVDTGLPVYLNPDRTLEEVIESGKGTSHDMAMLLTAALRALKLNPQVFLYRLPSSGELIGDMPALSQLDGVLVAVQSGKDLIWLDPTESLALPGVLPLSALGQQCLAVLAPVTWKTTPAFGAKDHRKERDVTMEFLPNGHLKCSVDLQAFGSSELSLRQFFRATTDDKRRELVLKGLAKRFPGVVLLDYRFGDYRNLTKPLDVHYSFEIPDYTQGTKDGFQFYPLVFEDVEDFLAALRDTRQTSVVIPQNFNSTTRVVVKLPPNYMANELPKSLSISNPVAEYLSNFKLDFGTLTYERYLGLKQKVISPGKEYQELLTFYQTVLSQDRTPFKVIRGNKLPPPASSGKR